MASTHDNELIVTEWNIIVILISPFIIFGNKERGREGKVPRPWCMINRIGVVNAVDYHLEEKGQDKNQYTELISMPQKWSKCNPVEMRTTQKTRYQDLQTLNV